MFISVIIPTYNRLSTLLKCLQNISNQSIDTENYEVIVVDDCSSDETQDYFKNHSTDYTNISYIRNNPNKGLASSRNVGIRAAKGDILVFLDNDLLVNFNFLEEHLKHHKAEKNIALVSDITYQPEDLEKTNFGRYIQSRAIGYRSAKNMRNIDTNNLPGNFFAGGGSSCKRDDAFKIGLFDENLKKYGSEDELFGHRLKKENVRIKYCKEAKIIHYDSNILPQYWKIKFIELGRYSFKYLAESNDSLITDSLFKFFTKINWEKDSLKTKTFKTLISIATFSFFRIPIEKFVFLTDSNKNLYMPLLYRYLTASWVKFGYRSNKTIKEVTY